MKNSSVVARALTVLFTAALLTACAGTDTKKADEAAAREAAETARQAEQAREADAAIELQRLEEAAEQVGNVFYFEFDSSALTEPAVEKLDAHIALLRQNNREIRLEGHTDERGTRDYNMALGERRANAVRDYMVANGIGTYRIETVSYGEERPVAYGSGEANWSQNRRVELEMK